MCGFCFLYVESLRPGDYRVSSIDRNIGCSELFHGYPQTFLAHAWALHRLSSDWFLAHSIQSIIRVPPSHSTIYKCSIAAESAEIFLNAFF